MDEKTPSVFDSPYGVEIVIGESTYDVQLVVPDSGEEVRTLLAENASTRKSPPISVEKRGEVQ